MKVRVIAFAIFALVPLSFITAEDRPVAGLFLPVPGAMSGTSFAAPSFIFSEDPRASAWNPAALSNRELPAFGASSSLAFPTGDGSGAGGSVSLSGAFPTVFGVAWGVADATFGGSQLAGWGTPSGGSGVIGLAKPLSERFSIGFGANVAQADESWTFGGTLGIELELPDFAPAGSVVSAALVGAGPALTTGANSLPIIAPTPIVAIASRLFESRSFSFTVSGLIATPNFTDIAATAGTSFGLGDLVSLDIGWNWSLRNMLSYADGGADADLYAFQFFPTISLRFDGSRLLKVGNYGVSLGGSLKPATDGVLVAEASALFSRGERDLEGPVIDLDVDDVAYSPKLIDSVPTRISIRDSSRIIAWESVVYDNEGKSVFHAGEDASSKQEAGPLKALFSIKKAASIPSDIQIPLTDLADGEYRMRVWAQDERGNDARIVERSFHVDGTSPVASSKIDGLSIFTPNGDGVRDVITIEQSGSSENEWMGTFRDAKGQTVRVLRWADSAPSSFAWDGRDDSGELLGDGVYAYELSSTDDAGNQGSTGIKNIQLDAEPTPVAISLSAQALSTDSLSKFSSIIASIKAPRKNGLVSWSISIIDDGTKTFRAWNGSMENLSLLPETIRFDGRNTNGDLIPDGRYRFRVSLEYANGNHPVATSAQFLVDSKKPSGRVRASVTSFNIDRGTKVVFYHDLSSGAEWRGLLQDGQGRVVKTFPLDGSTEPSVEWSGLDDAGNLVADGTYRYTAEGIGPVGLVGETAPVSIRVESGGFDVALIADRSLVSPISKDAKIRFLPRIARRDRVVSYELSIGNSNSQSPLRRFEGIAPIPAAIAWDGRDLAGVPLADGTYAAHILVRFDSGENVESEPMRVVLDSTPPTGKVSVSVSVFSPNGDGILDSIEIKQDADAEDSWIGTILDENDKIVRSYSWKGKPQTRLVWDGTDGNGAFFPDGTYHYQLSATDAAGNSFTTNSPVFRLDARIPAATISTDKSAFSPNGDGFADNISIRLVSAFLDGLDAWSVAIVDSSGHVVKKYAPASIKLSTASPPTEIQWNGLSDSDTRVRDGMYRAKAELRYSKGDSLQVESVSFALDTTPPEVALGLAPLPFSPDGDGEADSLYIDLKATDVNSVTGWILTILDPAGFPFTSFSGKDLPSAPFAWDGRNLDGDLVEAAQDYSYVLIVRDALGNVRKKEGSIPVDVFILRDGDRLKIRISSITFAPSSAALVGIDGETDAKNSRVLDRIAAVLAKFPAYRIRIEGHAVNISGTEREERTELEPLSLARARSVLDALVTRGVDRNRLEARGLGGREPLVPHGDVESRWRNRRVEFILVR